MQRNQKKQTTIFLLIDRIVVDITDEDFQNRVADSVQTAFFEGNGECDIFIEKADKSYNTHHFSNLFEADGMSFEEPDMNFFQFQQPNRCL
jgi:excinuclease ABC subunit A